MKKLADGLKLYARNLGLSDAEVARRAHLSEVRYGHYVRGRSEPDFATLLRICKVLNVSPNDLLLNTEEKTKKDEITILRNRITAGIRQLDKKQLLVVSRVIDEFLA